MADSRDLDKGSIFPKKRLATAFMGLVLTALGFIAEKLFKTILDTALSVVAGLSILLLIMGLVAFFGAWEKREKIHERKLTIIEMNVEEIHEQYKVQCQSCDFSHQSLLVGLSARHVNEIQEQRQYYEDYIAAVLYVLDTTILRLGMAEASVLPIVKGLMQSPLYKQGIENNVELKKWKNLLDLIREAQIKQD